MANINVGSDWGTGSSAQALNVDGGSNNPGALAISKDRVGIGTTSPGFRLAVEGAGVVTSIKSTNNDFTLNIKGNNDTTGAYIGSDSGALLFANSGGVENLRIAAGGSVGIGNTAPGEKLEVNGNVRVDEVTSSPTSVANSATIFARQLNSGSGVGLFARLNGQNDVDRNLGAVDWINVRDWGAKGDGSTDDRTAIQAAIDSLVDNGGVIYFPAGTYRICKTLFIGEGQIDSAVSKKRGNGTTLVGAGPSKTTLLADRSEAARNLSTSSTASSSASHLTTYTVAGGVTMPEVGDLVKIAGFTNTHFNGDFSVLKVSGSTFVVYNPNSASESEAGSGRTFTPNMHIIQIRGGQDDINTPWFTTMASIRNMKFSINGSQNDRHIAINIQHGVNCVLDNLFILGTASYNHFLEGIRVQAWCNIISNSYIANCTTGIRLEAGMLITGTAPWTASNANLLKGVNLQSFGTGIQIDGDPSNLCYGNHILGCAVQGNDSTNAQGVIIGTNSVASSVTDTYLEANRYGIQIKSKGNTVKGNFITGAVADAPGISIVAGQEDSNVVLGNYFLDATPHQVNWMSGSVGIGCTSPDHKFAVSDTAANLVTQAIFGQDKTSGQSQIAIGEQDAANKAFMIGYQHGTSPSGNYGYMQVSGDSIGSVLVIADGGSVGIGQTNPGAKLDVNGDVKFSTQGVRINAGTTNPTSTATAGNAGDLYVYINGTSSNLYIKLDNGTTTNWSPCKN